ncbi:MAG: efflux transporter periplasmic adaptor subunit [Flavobacterium psychrophilum]|jgi:cobalt-zinc-cadmium efflux system membrane fusion protein|nr:efflux RND transporter periplasmic adaptor subunit [Bacteroidota bacterium]MCH5688853.1 efflux RND transporter periplasmic adaptor subunit [Niabella sp. W65]MCH7367355.1 efflux RND transporter periplasmic adaptor subunit [Niabella sp. W65]PZR07014.1 MAG: efflux transporter periplasmic adaptor subunit [Flavobacterium psychrophilum]ULT43015.1 efflux RND transporter periplasmic adaptor subunit [Niabella sp. I65]
MLNSFYKPLFIAALFLAACSSKKSEETQSEKQTVKTVDPNIVEFTQTQYNAVGVQLGNVTEKNLSNYIKASGTIDVPPQQTISITSPYGGNIKTMNVIEGKYIGKGQVVATIENPEFVQIQQDYMESSSQLSFLKQDLTRQEELVKENIAARKSLQRAQSEYNSMVARVEGLKAKLRMININPARVNHGNFTPRSNIYAPQGGYVTKVYANVGKFVSANEVITDLANTNNMLVRVRVFEKDIPHISLGQTIRFSATGQSDEHIAKVSLIGKDIHEDRTVDVLARISSPSSDLLPGMFVNAIIELGASALPALPQEAVVQSGGKNYIFILAENTETTAANTTDSTEKAEEQNIAFRMVEVGVGITENGFTAVTLPEGFNMQSKVVLKGAYDLLSKMKNAEEEE